MDTIGRKKPVPLPFAGWQAMTPAEAAREVAARVAALSPAMRTAAIAWLRPEKDLAEELERWNGLTSRRSQRVGDNALRPPGGVLSAQSESVANKLAPTREPLHPLRGVPYFLKDLFDVAGVPTGAGSTFLDKVRATRGDSEIVGLLRRLGAALAGKTQLVEFASGLTGENPHFGDCPHPQFPNRLTGGSSSGSAAMVAAGVVPLAIGTDTGGSIRVPAAFCGLYGFRLTPGDALIADAFPLARTMDTAGWFTANAPDMLTTWRQLAFGRASPPDEPSVLAQTAARPEDSPYLAKKAGQPRGCYLPGQSLIPGMDPDVGAACDAAAAKFCPVVDAATRNDLLASWSEAVDAYVTIGMSEANAVHRNWLAPYREHYDPVIWQRFTDAGHYPPEKIAAARATMARVRSTWAQFFRTYDFLVMPCAPCAAPTKAECTPTLRRNILALTAPTSLGGLPCLSIPVALSGGLTAGQQIVAKEPRSPVFAWVLGR